MPFIYGLSIYIYKKEYRWRSTVGFPWRFAMCFIGIDGLIFSLSETLVVTLFFLLFLLGRKFIHIFLDFQREKRYFCCVGGVIWGYLHSF